MPEEPIQLPRLARLLWEGQTVQRPGPKPGLDLSRIAKVGIALADAGGIAGVSMAKVAAELGVSTMALYRYVSSKQELVDLMLDQAYGPPPTDLEPEGGWPQWLRAWADALRAVLLRHRWILMIPITEPPLTPCQVLWTEQGLAAFRDTPLTAQDKFSALLLTDNYVRGITQLALDPTPDDQGIDAGRRYAMGMATLAIAHDLPHLAAAIGGGGLDEEPDQPEFSQQEFGFGLDTLIDGIEALMARRRAGSLPPVNGEAAV